MDNVRSKERLTKIITEKPELLQNLNISPRKLLLFVEHLENNNVVVREKGEWVEGKKETLFRKQGNYICSNCKSHTGIVKFNFCPNCGADMRKKENG